MKNMKLRFISLFLVVMMVLSAFPMGVFATETETQSTQTTQNAAEVDEASETTLAEVIAKAENGATVTLQEDVVLTDTLTIPAGKAVTLDLNGKTISQTKECTASYSMIANNGTLTITGKGKLSFTDTGAGDPDVRWASYTVRNNGTLVVENGTIEHLGTQTYNGNNAIFSYSGSVTINDGVISAPYSRSLRVWHGGATINGGTFDGQVWVQAMSDVSLTINGGSFRPATNGNDGSSVYITNDTHKVALSVTGGTFNTKIGCKDASKLKGSITGGTFGDLSALNYLADGADVTVKLANDVELTDTVTVPAGAKVTLDLNGKTVSQQKAQTTAYAMIDNKGELTITDSVGGGKLSYADTSVYTQDNGFASNTVRNEGVLTVAGGTIENVSSDNVKNYGYPHAIDVYQGSVTNITGGVVKSVNYDAIRMFCNSATESTVVNISGGTIYNRVTFQQPTNNFAAKGELNITGGNFISTTGKANVRLLVFGADCSQMNATISGGRFDQGVAISNYSGGTVTWKPIIGGTFGVAPAAEYLADGYSVVANKDGTYTVVSSNAVEVEDTTVDTIVDSIVDEGATEQEKEAVKEVVETIVSDLVTNGAMGGNYAPTNLPEDAKLVVTLTDIELNESKDAPKKLVFDIAPMKDNAKVEPTEAITFRLPIPETVTEAYAKVYHEGDYMGTYAIKTANGGKYVELSSADFSEYAVEFTDVKASYVAEINGVGYETLAEAFAAAQNGDTVTLLTDLTIDTETYNIADGVAITFDMNGKKLTVTDNRDLETCYELFYIYGQLTVTGNGTIELTATNNDTAWAKSSSIFHNRGGVLNIMNGTFTHKGGTGMAFVVDNSGNHYGDATTNIYEGTLTSSYIAIRNRMEQNSHGASGTAYLNIYGGTINGTSRAIWGQAASASTTAPATGAINVSGGTVGLIDTPRSNGAESMTTISGGTVAAFKGEVGELTVTGSGTITGDVTILTASGETTNYAVTEDGKYVSAVAKIGDVGFTTLDAALSAAVTGQTVTLLTDVTLTEKITLTKSINIDGNGHTLTFTSTRGIDVLKDNAGTEVTISNLTIVKGGSYFERGINFNSLNGKLTLDNVTVSGPTYALNMPIGGVGATVTVTDSDLSGCIALNVWCKDATITVTDTALTSVDTAASESYSAVKLNNDGTNVAEGTTITINGGSITALDENGEWSYAVNNSTSTGTINVSDTTVVQGEISSLVAVIRYGDNSYGYFTLQDAVNGAADDVGGATVILLKDITLTETVKVPAGSPVTIDLNGKTITGTDNNTSGNFYLINVQKDANLTLTDSVGGGTITLTAATERNWTASSVVIANNQGTLTIEGGTIEHLGGTSMAYALDNLTNGTIGDAVMVINGGTINSTYFAIRQFANSNSKNNSLTINGGTIGYVWMQSPNDNVNTVETAVVGGEVDGVCLTGKNADLDLSVKADCVGEVYGTMPNGMLLTQVNGSYTLETADVAVTDREGNVTYYATLDEALLAAASGSTVKLTADVENAGNVIVGEGVILDLNGYTLKATYVASFGTVTDSSAMEGKLVVAKSRIHLNDDNAAMPIWDVDGYRFAEMDMQVKREDDGTDSSTVSFSFRPTVGNTELNNEYFADGMADNGLKLEIHLEWTSGETEKDENIYISEASIQNIYENGLVVVYTLSNIADTVSNLKISIVLVSDVGVQTAEFVIA